MNYISNILPYLSFDMILPTLTISVADYSAKLEINNSKQPLSEKDINLIKYKKMIEWYIGYLSFWKGVSQILFFIKKTKENSIDKRSPELELAIMFVAFGLTTMMISRNPNSTLGTYITISNMYMFFLSGLMTMYISKMIFYKELSKKTFGKIIGNILPLYRLIRTTNDIKMQYNANVPMFDLLDTIAEKTLYPIKNIIIKK